MSESAGLIYLSESTLEGLGVTTADVIESIEHLVRGRGKGKGWNAPKATVSPPDGRYIMVTLAVADDPPLLAVKSLVLNPHPKPGFKQINALVTVLDSHTGIPVAVVDGNWVTAVRTAGLSAVAAKRLARVDSASAAFIGCGVQAHSHLRAFVDMFPLTQVRAFGRGSANRDAFCQAAEDMGVEALACPTAQEAVRDADLVVTSVTLSPELEPFLDATWLKPGVFATITDLAASWMVDTMAAFDQIIIDDREQEAQMETPLVPAELIAGDLCELVNGDVPGRQDDGQRIAFAFRGLALGDLALAALAYQIAKRKGRGASLA